MSLEHDLWKLEALRSAAMDEMALNDRVYDAVEAALGRIAREHYRHLGNWRPEQLRALAETNSHCALSFAIDLSRLDYAGLQKE